MKKCVFAGTFDPPTVGHEYVINRCLEIFDCVTVAVMVNPEKTPYLTVLERVELIKKLFKDDDRIKVISFGGAAVDLLESENTRFYVRGIRDVIDFEYENRNARANEKLLPDIVNIYIPARKEDEHVSSSLVKNSVRFKKAYSDYIPKAILKGFEKIIENKGLK